MTSGFIRVPADDAGKRVDTATLTDELVEVHRQKMVISGGSGTAEVVVVTNAAPAGTDMGLVVRQAGTATVTGTVNVNGGVAISGTAIVAGTVNVNGGVAISGTAQVAIGTPVVVNNISATVVVSGLVGLTAGTAVIGDINAISRTVQVAVGTPFTLQGISTTVLVAVSTPFTLNNISATTIVAGNVNISTMPAVTIAAGQTINNISASVQVATGAVADFNTSADVTQNLPLIGIAQSAAGGAVAWGGSVSVINNINISATPSVILAAGTANFGTLNDISKTVQVAIATPYILQGISTTVQVAVGTPFTVNNISASVVIATGASFDFNTLASADQVQNVALFGIALPASGGASVGGTNANPLWVNINAFSQTAAVVLAAGTANFGTLNDISKTVQVAIGTPFILQGISTTVTVVGVVSLAAGTILDSISATVGVKGQVSLGAGTSNIGFINNISATVTVVGNVNISATPSVILAAGTANFGTLNDISRTVQVAIGTPYILQGISTTVTTVVAGYTPAVMSASRGPKCVTASTSANVTLIASPGAGANIYVTRLMVGNFSSTLTRARIGTSASISTIVQPLAASGGGFVLDFDPPWMLSASEAALCSVKPNVADAYFTVHFFVR